MAGSETPLMRQYWDIKRSHPDKIVLFRMGDFYEMFHDDAVKAAPILGIALTSRNKKAQDETPMCGVPHHSIAGPINRLLAANLKVAICEQMEDPALAKGLVKRAVTRILSPGMVYDPDNLDATTANYICAYDDQFVAFLEATTGEAFYMGPVTSHEMLRLIEVLRPAEILVPENSSLENGLPQTHHTRFVDTLDPEKKDKLAQWLQGHSPIPAVAELLLQYVLFMQGTEILSTLRPFECRKPSGHLHLSSTVIRHLELFRTYKGEKKGSLFEALDRTKTSAGSRRLQHWLNFPLLDQDTIEARLDQVAHWVGQPIVNQSLRAELSRLGDIERRLAKIAGPGCNARDLQSLAQSLQVAEVAADLADIKMPEAVAILAEAIASTLRDELPLATKQGHLIRPGVDSTLDELVEVAEHSQSLLLEFEAREKNTTAISSLKVRYNQVFGYYIEVTHTHKEKVPGHYQRKQTLANAERFTTPELTELERKILSSGSRRAELEFELFSQLRSRVLQAAPFLMEAASQMAELDALSSLAWLAVEQNYIRPRFLGEQRIKLTASRHPVVEQVAWVRFVANTIELKEGECLLLTGPNMAGKSTLMRQVAVSVIMAQMGSFVAAERAEMGLFHQLFTRIGASDFIAEGLSTFMVEMKETAEMLEQAGPKDLVLLDEVGRGTSTYDGMSLAQAILEHLLENAKPLVLFATHYHELTCLAERYPHLHNGHMSIREKGGEIFFLHTLVKGPATSSYGIHVAKLAGLPASVTHRAREILQALEHHTAAPAPETPPPAPWSEARPELDAHLRSLKELNISTLTPLDALNQIAKWQQSLS